MRKLLLVIALFAAASSINRIDAQNINVNINIGRQPAWGPVGYDYVAYYYFPDINTYYNVDMGMFHYFEAGRWVAASRLPRHYGRYDLYSSYKVPINTQNPWMYNGTHYRDYANYRDYRNKQVVIRDSRDVRYKDSRNNNVGWHHEEDNNKGNSRSGYDNPRGNNKEYNRETKDSNREYQVASNSERGNKNRGGRR